MATRSPFLRWVNCIAIVFLLLPLLGTRAVPQWSRLNCWSEDVYIATGRIRKTWYLCYVRVSQRIEESAFSRELPIGEIQNATPQWHRINTFSPGVHYSPHYYFHGALHQVSCCEEAWELGRFRPEARCACARRMLQLWQSGSADEGARGYCHAIQEVALNSLQNQRETVAADLPP